jgi:hypothetical protein
VPVKTKALVKIPITVDTILFLLKNLHKVLPQFNKQEALSGFSSLSEDSSSEESSFDESLRFLPL